MKPVKIIFDTDIGWDCDDAGTLAMLHRLCDKGEAELLAVTHCFATPYVAGCIDAINRFYGREVPVGINYSEIRENDRGEKEIITNPAPDFVLQKDDILALIGTQEQCRKFENFCGIDLAGTPAGAEQTAKA